MTKTEQTITFNGQESRVTMWQDAAGTIPVTEYGQPVGLLLSFEPPLVFTNGPEDELEQAAAFNQLIDGLKKT